MKKNRYVLIAVVLLTVIAFIFILTNSTNTFKRSQSDFAVDDTSNITTIFMANKNNHTLKMTRQLPGSDWIINDKYPGHKFNINMLLETMLNIQVKEPVPIAARNNMIKALSVNSVKVEIYQWVKSEFKRIFEIYGPFDHMAIKQNENISTRYSSVKPVMFMDCISTLVSIENNTTFSSHLYTGLGTKSKDVVSFVESKVVKSNSNWDSQIADAIAAAIKIIKL